LKSASAKSELSLKFLKRKNPLTEAFKKPELLAPAGDFAMLHAAIASGADAIYLGVRGLNMRVRAQNFSVTDLATITARCHARNVRVYLALNTIIFENELTEVQRVISAAREAGVDAIIGWDLAVLALARAAGMPVHLSTQASVANSTAIRAYQALGVSRFILARECSLEQIQTIKAETGAEIETFVHGAMCVSESGRCFISQFLYGKSANRGECLQPCRREYRVTDLETGDELTLGHNFVMSPKDLCALGFIDKLIEARIDAFKIEGRARSPEYVRTVVAGYRQAIDLYFSGELTDTVKKQLIENLQTVYNRGFSSGFFLGKPLNAWTTDAGSLATSRKEFLGVVSNFYKKPMAADILLQAGDLKIGEELLFVGETTGAETVVVDSLQLDKVGPVTSAPKGATVGVQVPVLVRRNDQVYKIIRKKG
jgi:putative protease